MIRLIFASNVGAATYYVDASAADSGDGSEFSPFRTIQAAADIMVGGDRCVIRAGTYRETVVPAASGTDAEPIVFEAYPDEAVTITGCDPVSGWTPHSGEIYKTAANLTLGHENQIFADGEMMLEARWPNAGRATPTALMSFATAKAADGSGPEKIVHPQLPAGNWTNAYVWVAAGHKWFCWTAPVTSATTNTLSFPNNADRGGNMNMACRAGAEFYVAGALAALDAENEWYYDSAAGLLYVYAPGGGDPGNRIEVKRRMYAFDLSARAHIILRGIRIHAASILTDSESHGMVLDGLDVKYVYHSSKADQQYLSQRDTGLILQGSSHIVRNCEIAYSSGNCLLLGAQAENCLIVNNYIHHGGYIGSYASVIEFAEGTRGHVVSHNTLRDAGRSVIGTGGLYDSLIQYNDMSRSGHLTSDLGLTYGNGVDGGNSEIRYNWLYDNLAKGHNAGLYFDHGCRNLIIHHNVIWGARIFALQINQYANYILCYNNTMSDAKFSYASDWANNQAKEQYGCRLVNNVGDARARIKADVKPAMISNAWDYADLQSKRYLTPGTAPVDSGVFIAGITTDIVNNRPDMGAYELGGMQWVPGHNFENPPLNVDTNRSLPRHRNLLVNPAHHRGALSGWTTLGDHVQVIYERHGQAVIDGRTLFRSYSVEMGTGTNRILQTVHGLQPATPYELMGMFRVPSGEAARLGAYGFGGNETNSAAVTRGAPYWERSTLRFQTGPTNTSVTIYAEKTSPGAQNIYIDNMGLQSLAIEGKIEE